MAYAGHRFARNGVSYTYDGFLWWYGDDAAKHIWQQSAVDHQGAQTTVAPLSTIAMNTDTASASTQPVATEHGTFATTATAVTGHNTQFVVTEHMTESVVATTSLVCLTPSLV